MATKRQRQINGRKGAQIRWAKAPTLAERFWDNVDKRGPKDCWPWKLSKFKNGYGKCKTKGQSVGAHRVAYQLANGPIKNGLQVRHSCDNPPCCNPDHLLSGTHADNMKDCIERGRHRPGRRGWIYGGGENAPNRKLSKAQVAKIRLLAKKNLHTQTAIARKFGVGQDQISRIVHRKRWAS